MKTQVFPLERNAAVRSRLTHSLEVQQVGRYIAKEILNRFKQDKKITAYGLDKLLDPFESIVEMACLMHDIGNPPFGHFGESAINDWFTKRMDPNGGSGSEPQSYVREKPNLIFCAVKFVMTLASLRATLRLFVWFTVY